MTTGIFLLLFFYPSNLEAIENQHSFSPISYAGNMGQVIELLDDFDNEPKKDNDNWIGMDKFWHWAVAFTLTGSTYHLVHNQLHTDDPCASVAAVSSTVGFSVLKEFYDLATYGLFSFKDLAYDMLGISPGMSYL